MPAGRKIVSVVGARPQFVKLAPVARAIASRNGVGHAVVHTGQHYDANMSASFFDDLELPVPDVDLGVGSASHAAQTAAMLTQLETYFLAAKPDVVLVYGDTNSTLAATLAAAKIHLRVAHIEAGLRSFDRSMPEEINRLVADHCADRLYAPTPQAARNLAEEHLAGRTVVSGDVMLDAVQFNARLAGGRSILADLRLEPGRYGLVTVHRAANTTDAMLPILLEALEASAASLPLVFPVHPRTRAAMRALGYSPPASITLLEPLPYLDNLALIEQAALVVTDSGGVQKEAAFLHTPCLTVRPATEWTETVELGINRLVADPAGLPAAVKSALEAENMFNDTVLQQLGVQYGNGHAAELIIDDCLQWLG